jgi:hypothetical protein
MKRTALTGAAAGGVGVALVLYFCDPVRVPIYPVCLLHRLTGLDCPGCGSLRALHALLHGQWTAALHFNLFLVLSLPLLATFGIRSAWNKAHGGPGVTVRPLWLWVYAAAAVAFGILRNLPFPWFASFAS